MLTRRTFPSRLFVLPHQDLSKLPSPILCKPHSFCIDLTLNASISSVLTLAAENMTLPPPLEPDAEDPTKTSSIEMGTMDHTPKATATSSKVKSGGKVVKMRPSATRNGQQVGHYFSDGGASVKDCGTPGAYNLLEG
jgi:hypothetical protein